MPRTESHCAAYDHIEAVSNTGVALPLFRPCPGERGERDTSGGTPGFDATQDVNQSDHVGNDRVYRIGQTKAVTIHVPIARHPDYGDASFDVTLDELLRRKRSLSRHMLAPPVGSGDVADSSGMPCDPMTATQLASSVARGAEPVAGPDRAARFSARCLSWHG